MYIVLRFVCENFSRLAVKISFLWVFNIVFMQQRHFQKLGRRDVYATTRKILLLLFCI